MAKNLKIDIENSKRKFDDNFVKILNYYIKDSYLNKVMRYSILNGGKRIRPYLIKEFSIIKGIKPHIQYRIASTIEVIHCYSLIHDDLPSMDNDDFRRGKLSTHKKFNEAQAILAGDSLHDLAFEILSDKKFKISSYKLIKLINFLSKSLGSNGLAGGQSLDLLYESKSVPINNIINMYKLKTGALFKFCCASPFLITRSNKNEINFAMNYGELFGILFQIIDDYLDFNSSKKEIGKTPKKDIKQRKSTLNKTLKTKNLKKICDDMVKKFCKKNSYYFKRWPKLKLILYYLLEQFD